MYGILSGVMMMEEKMNITEFAKSRNKDPQAVRRYISRNAKIFDGLTIRKGKDVLLTDEALQILDKAYPPPKPVEVIVDHQSRDELIKAQREIIRLQAELNEQNKLLARAEYHQLLLEQKDAELKRAAERAEEQERMITEKDEDLQQKQSVIQTQEEQLQAANDQNKQLQEQLAQMQSDLQAEREHLEQMQNTGLFGRIFKKW